MLPPSALSERMKSMIRESIAMWQANRSYIDTFYLCNKYGETFDRAHTIVDYAVVPEREKEYVSPLSPIEITGKSLILFVSRVSRDDSLSLFTPLLQEFFGVQKLYRLLHVFGGRIYYDKSLSKDYDLSIKDRLAENSSFEFSETMEKIISRKKRILFPHVSNYARILGKNVKI